MKKILFIHHAGTIGGAPWSLLYTIKALDPSRFSAHVLFLEPGKVAELFEKEGISYSTLHDQERFKGYHRFVHIEPVHCKWYQLYQNFRMFRWWHRVSTQLAPKELSQLDFDMVHLNSITLIDWAKAAKSQGKKVIMHVREPLAKGFLGVRRSFIRKQIADNCDRVIAISQDNASRVNLPEKCTVVYNFSDFDKFNLQAKPLIDRENGYFYLLYMGGSKKFKGYELLVKSLKHIDQNVRLILAGNYKRMKKQGLLVDFKRFLNRVINRVPDFEQVIHDPRVIYVGLTTEVPALIQSSDAVVFPATKTHFPRPLIEGMAMKKLALSFDIEGISEVIKEGENGMLVSQKRSKDLASGINKMAALTGEQYQRMSENAYRFATSNFSLRNIEKITSIYDEI
jgi:glycosyltransferase involved in cell wall biosynthesis